MAIEDVYNATLDELDAALADGARLRQQLAEAERDNTYLQDQLDCANIRNDDLTAALDRALGQLNGGTW